MTDLNSYFEQFRGDEPVRRHFVARFEMGDGYATLVPARADDPRAIVVTVGEQDNRAVCRANGKHEWYMLHGGLQCRQCGEQIYMAEPASQFNLREAIWRSIELDAELRNSRPT